MSKRVQHELPPIYDADSQILILGSIPSVKSREVGFYYAHPQNRFWKVLEHVFACSIEDKEQFLHEYHLALWDVLASCEISSSKDSSIKKEMPNNLQKIIKQSQIKLIVTTGKTAHKYYQKYFQKLPIKEICLPSTSPANCAIKMPELVEAYSVIKENLL